MDFNFRKVNRIAGWLAFAISLTIYFLTLEPTVSYWDCGEFLSCAVNLEVPHAPGAPFFILLGRLAAILYPANPTIMVNGLSAVSSAFTILLLFFTISWFGRKLFSKTWEQSIGQKIAIISGSFIGAMAYAVSDSFWFSAVETEVYALSSLFTALVFWCITRWEENNTSDVSSERWLLLIAYLLGLSIGVHLLNLLAIPAIVMVYFIKSYPFNTLNLLKAVAVSVGLLLSFLIFIPGIPAFLSSLELLAVNVLGLSFNSGLISGIIFIGLVLYVIHKIAVRKGKPWLQRVAVYAAYALIGFSPYGIVLVRSHDNPSIDMANPDNPFSLENYLNREQYGKRPLLYGQSFASPAIAAEDRFSYQRFMGKYVKYPLNPDVTYDKHTLMPFPRLCNDEPGQVEAYKRWIGDYHGRPYYSVATGKQIQLPTFGENLRFFFSYQLGYMYFRYFMWNFAGRQNDILGHGTVIHGNWISGIPILDNMRLGPQDQLPTQLKTNKAHNRYFCLPLLLGLLGLWFHSRYDKQQFCVALFFFLLTGVAIAVYLNEVPVIPRERDYVYVGSFYVFAIWIGIGVMAMYQWMANLMRLKWAAVLSACVASGIPILMGIQNWDDHSRVGRYGVLEYARNYLESCEPNAILFTNADNDTYPLWYAQEVAGIRRDIRIVLLPYLSADWYVNQMRTPQFKQMGLDMHVPQDKYVEGKRTYLPIVERTDSAVDVKEMLDFVASDDSRAKIELTSGERINYIPTRRVILSAPRTYQIPKSPAGIEVDDSVLVSLSGNNLRMDNLVLLDILAANDWKRPVYFASPQVPMEVGLAPYLQLRGFAYKLTPHKENFTDQSQIGYIDPDCLYNQYMHEFSFVSVNNPAVYLDYTHITQLNVLNLRSKFARLAETLIDKGDSARAEKVLDRITAMLPNDRLAYEIWNAQIAELYLRLGCKQKGRGELLKLKNYCYENLRFFNALSKSQIRGINYEVRLALYMLQQIAEISVKYGCDDVANECRGIWASKSEKLLETIGD